MGSKTPKTPPSPDPNAVAAAQTGSNLTTAIGNTWMANANYVTPFGTTKTKQSGTKKVTDPSTGKTYEVPNFTYTTSLSKDQKKLLDQQERLGMDLNSMATGQVNRLKDHLSRPIDFNSLPQVGGGLQDVKDFDTYRQEVNGAMNARLNEDLGRDYNSLENRLINQGLTRGSEAFTKAMDEHGRNANDARVQTFLASGQEARSAGAYDQNKRSAQLTEQMGLRNQRLSELLTERNQPVNEITALMSGGQVTAPQMPQFQGSQMSETPIGQYTYQNWSQNNQRAQQQAQANGQMWSNVGNVASGLFRWSDVRLKTDIEFLHDDGQYRWYMYRYNGDCMDQIGVMAQEVLAVNPDAVVLMPNGFYAVDYGRL